MRFFLRYPEDSQDSCYLHQDNAEIRISYTCTLGPNFANTIFKPNEFLIIFHELCLLCGASLEIIFSRNLSKKKVCKEFCDVLYRALFHRSCHNNTLLTSCSASLLAKFYFPHKIHRRGKKNFRWLFPKLFLSVKNH